MASPTRAVFFDLGGTLFSNLEIPKVSAPLLQEAARRIGARRRLDELGAAYLAATRRANESYRDRNFYLHRDLFLDTYRYFAESLGARIDDEFLVWLYEAQREIMATKIRLRADCVDTLRTLRDRGLGLSLVSNIDDDYLEPMMQNLGLAPLFDHWSSSHEARSCKPHSRFFHYAMEKAGCSAGEVVFVGDSRLHDVKGARAVGMTAVLIEEAFGRSALDVEDCEPDFVIAELGELPALIEDRDRSLR